MKWAPLVVGGALVAYGLSRKSKGGMLMAAAGGAVAYTGYNQQGKLFSNGSRDFARSTLIINASASEVFSFWRKFENLPRFMHHLESVTETSPSRSHWVALGPGNSRVEWTAEIVEETPNKLIAWRSVEGSDIQVDGSVEFREAPAGRGTFVDATIQYRPPAGKAGSVVAKLFGKDPSFLMEQDMRRFKALIEAGEIPTTEGQTNGPRSFVAPLARAMDPDRVPPKTSPQGQPIGRGGRRVS